MADNRKTAPKNIIVRGARVHNLKNIDVDIPLGKLVAIAGVSGSGKSSLALGTLYAEGSRRYLEALSTYTRRQIAQAGRAEADEIRHVPAALALHQRPGIPGIRSTFGTASELLNSLRLMFSRLGSHCCPNGHLCSPSINVALMLPIKCEVCGEEFYGPGAEAMAFNSEGACPTYSGTGIVRTVDESALVPWVRAVPDTLPEAMGPMADSIIQSFLDNAKRLNDLGLGYLSLDRAGNTLSTGERQRVQLARAVRNETTGVLYVLDEPSIGLHPSNIDGLMAVVDSLIADGNSVVLVDHDVRVLKRADHMIEMGPQAGSGGGSIVAQGGIAEIARSAGSKIAPFLTRETHVLTRKRAAPAELFTLGTIRMETAPVHTVHDLTVALPKGRLTVVTGVSGSGKTTMVLESLIPALNAYCAQQKLPLHVKRIEAPGIRRANLIDASPIGINIRSTVATYSGVLDNLRKLYAATESAKSDNLKAGDFSYNTGSLRCATCDGTGQISLDVHFCRTCLLSALTATANDTARKRRKFSGIRSIRKKTIPCRP